MNGINVLIKRIPESWTFNSISFEMEFHPFKFFKNKCYNIGFPATIVILKMWFLDKRHQHYLEMC